MAEATNRPEPSARAATMQDAGASLQQVERVLARIRPMVQEDGGDLELVSVDPDGLVRIRLHGACVGCPSAHQTLHHGIERALRAELGAAMRVEAVG